MKISVSFTTNLFLTLFLPVTICITLLFRKHLKGQNAFLLLVNCIFLLFSGVGGLLLLFLTCIIDYLFVLIIQKKNPSKSATICFVFALVLNIIPLLFFKYTGFVIDTINSAINLEIVAPKLTVPLGISFYTFQAISLLSDVKTKKITNKPKFFDVCFYLSFFTTITSGPIVRFNDIQQQLAERTITPEKINAGFTRFVVGLGKKVILANTLAIFIENIFAYSETSESLSMLAYWFGSIAFTLQLYLDFSGYSDMAIGVSKILGINIPENFNYPYTAKTIGEFWRKWHISLSQWFRDYIYIPLGGNRVSASRHIINLFVVWCLTGIWHGANWTFIVWGLMYFALLVFEKYCKPVTEFFNNHFAGHIYTLFFVNLIWVFFRASSLTSAGTFVLRMFGVGSIGVPIEESTLHIIPFLIISAICCFPILKLKCFTKLQEKRYFGIIKAVILSLILVISICTISNSSTTPFIYGNF